MKDFIKLCNEYGKLRDVMYSAYTNYAKRNGLTTTELLVFIVIYTSKECTQKDICLRLSTNKQTISEIIKKFVNLGYLSLEGSNLDKRSKIVCLTENGHEIIDPVVERLFIAESKSMEMIGEENAQKLIELTTMIAINMKNNFEQIEVIDNEDI